jgi:hypothetical protein
MLHCGTCGPGSVCGLYMPERCGSCTPDEHLESPLPLHLTGRPHHHRSRGWDDDEYDELHHSMFDWTVPYTGSFVISAAGSEGDVWMSLSAQACAQEPLTGPTPAFPARYELQKGQHVYLKFSGQWNRFGGQPDYQLRISGWVPDERGRCGNRTDDDGDGVLDCWDPDCAPTSECLRGSACADVDLSSALPASGSNNASGLPDFFRTSCGIPGHSERTFSWTAPQAGKFVFQPVSGYGSVISARSGCRGAELACSVASDMLSLNDKQAVLVREMASGESIVLVLEGWYSLEHHKMETPSTLLVHEWRPEEDAALCTDGRDNDGDGHVDEMDPGCPNHGQGG